MALYIRGNRILTQREKDNEDLNDGCTDAVMLLIGVLGVLSPGILITSYLISFFDFSTSQLWGAVIVASLAVLIVIAIICKGEGVIKAYLGTALCCVIFMGVYSLFKSDNRYLKTLEKMFDTESSNNDSPQDNASTDSIAYNAVSNYTNDDILNEHEETDIEAITETEEESVDNDNEETSSSEETSTEQEDCIASFPGGNDALHEFVKSHMYYPPDVKAKGIHGTVTVRFTVLEDGKITCVSVTQGIDPALDAEAVRIIKSMPNWNPKIKNGEAVISCMNYYITFE